MNTKLVIVSVLISAGFLASASAAGRGSPGNGRGQSNQEQVGPLYPECPNPDCPYVNPNSPYPECPNPECPGPQQNPDRQPKRDGTGGPNQPDNPDCPHDGSGYPWGE